MKRLISIFFAAFVCFTFASSAQIPVRTLVQISRAEDELRFDKTLEDLMKSANAKTRARAALAAGRIGKDTAIAPLTELLEKDLSVEVRETATFAVGEIESVKGVDAILIVLQNKSEAETVRARAVEAAGKIAAANAKDEKSKLLGAAILNALNAENARGSKQSRLIILLGITAILRAKPEGGDTIAAKFLSNTDARIRADAANTLSRLRSKIAVEKLRAMLVSDGDAIARANAARSLGAVEATGASGILLGAAFTDNDIRVRVSAIRSLGALKDARAAEQLLTRGETLLDACKKTRFANPAEKNELLEIATALSRILANSNDKRAVKFLEALRKSDKFNSPETEISFARIAPADYLKSDSLKLDFKRAEQNWLAVSSMAQGLGEFAAFSEKNTEQSKSAENLLRDWLKNLDGTNKAFADVLRAYISFKPEDSAQILRQILYDDRINFGTADPTVLVEPYKKLYDAVQQKNLAAIEKSFSRTTVELVNEVAKTQKKTREEIIKNGFIEGNLSPGFPELGNEKIAGDFGKIEVKNLSGKFDEAPFTRKNGEWKLAVGEVFKGTFPKSVFSEHADYDVIATATAAELLGELPDNHQSVEALKSAYTQSLQRDKKLNDAQLSILSALVKLNKKEAVALLKTALDAPDFLVRRQALNLIEQNNLFAEFPDAEQKVGAVKPYNSNLIFGSKLGVILNTQADYVRAVSRRKASAVLTMEKGTFTIEFFPQDAPLTVDNFIKLARAKYFNGLTIHRVVPNFVVQDGDPRGDGSGGPGWEIRDEINMKPYERGTVGMALSGRDTGGSQWFVCHSPQPHLDGGYTVFGRVNEAGMKVVDNLARGDKILSVKIVEGN